MGCWDLSKIQCDENHMEVFVIFDFKMLFSKFKQRFSLKYHLHQSNGLFLKFFLLSFKMDRPKGNPYFPGFKIKIKDFLVFKMLVFILASLIYSVS